MRHRPSHSSLHLPHPSIALNIPALDQLLRQTVGLHDDSPSTHVAIMRPAPPSLHTLILLAAGNISSADFRSQQVHNDPFSGSSNHEWFLGSKHLIRILLSAGWFIYIYISMYSHCKIVDGCPFVKTDLETSRQLLIDLFLNHVLPPTSGFPRAVVPLGFVQTVFSVVGKSADGFNNSSVFSFPYISVNRDLPMSHIPLLLLPH